MDIPDYFVSEGIFPPGTYTTATKQQPPKVTPAINSKIPLGTSDVNICSNLGDIRSLYIHKPHSSTALDITVGSTSYRFTEDDHLYKMLPFLSMIPPDLQSTRSANESNRCFFIHLGIAVGIHPFALQTAFRYLAINKLESVTPKSDADGGLVDNLFSSLTYAELVDANILVFLWLQDFNSLRVCIVSDLKSRAMFSVFYNKDYTRDVIMNNNGSHFTLLKPDPHTNLTQLLQDAEKLGHTVYNCQVESDNENSVLNIISTLTATGND